MNFQITKDVWETEESALGIGTGQIDGINETFNSTGHPDFTVGSRLMTGCLSVQPFDSTQEPDESSFWSALLTTTPGEQVCCRPGHSHAVSSRNCVH